ncbi:hypothetical protein [Bdellovibrio sp. HCB209]|uniref:hypothetical protein n=1 Tax=Bdellovibrio sp. HCB209 TaxID=3394354 RepID=UPI0039B6B35C
MKLSLVKLALIVGTPVVMMGYQNCAKLGTDNLIGQTSGFVTSESTELASSSTGSTETASSSQASRKNRYPSSDPMGHSQVLLADVIQKCTGKESQDEFVAESCLVLACQTPSKIASQQRQLDELCVALQRSQSYYALSAR